MSDSLYDVFISSSPHDAAWVRAELLPRLEGHGLQVCLAERDFQPGAPYVTEIERAIQTSRHTLLVLTPHYVTSAWAAFERVVLQTLDPAGRARRLIPLLRTPCTLPLSIDALTRVDFTTGQEWNRLLAALSTPSAPQPLDTLALSALPGLAALPPGSRMPLSHNPLFVGRERELRALIALLTGDVTAAIQQPVAATGLGGIGKTQLASEFVHRYGQFFPGGVFWLSCEHADAVPAEIARCGGAGFLDLRPNFADLTLDEQVQLVLQAWQLDTPRLLVFDNCEDEALLNRWRPTYGGCRILVTSRRAHWSSTLGVQALKLATLPRAESIALLRKHCPDLAPDDPDLDALAHYLGDLPLALHVAGSFLALYQDDDAPGAYLAELQAAGGIDAELLDTAEISATGHDQSVWRTFQLSYDKLDGSTAADGLALTLLAHAAYCAPGEPLPRDLLIATIGIDSEDTKATRQATRSLKRLNELGLLEIEGPRAVRLHRLLAAFVRAVSPADDAQAAVEQAILSLAEHVNKIRDPRLLRHIEPQFRAVTAAAQERLDRRAADLCAMLGAHLYIVGDYRGTDPYLHRALAIREQILGPLHPATAESLNQLGVLLQAQGDFHHAECSYRRALAINEQVLGSMHAHTGVSLNNLGDLLLAQGDLDQAATYLERALAIREQALGAMHPDVAESLNNLGLLFLSQDDLDQAATYLERALAIREQVLGSMHPDTANSLNNLAGLMCQRDNLPEAVAYLERALAIREQVLGTMHPDTAVSLNNLGRMLLAQGNLDEALAYMERALVIWEQGLGATHPDTAYALNSLGRLLCAQGDYLGAHAYLERGLKIREQVLGTGHRDTAKSLESVMHSEVMG